jgi:hypothetical protein
MSEVDELAELRELEELRSLEKNKQQEQPAEAPPEVSIDPSMGVTSAAIEVPQELQNPEADEAIQMGAVQGVPFLKDGYFAFKALADQGPQSFGEVYHKEQRDWQQHYDGVREKYPTHANLGDAISTTAVGVALPSGIVSNTLYGAFSSASREETRNPSDMLSSGVMGGALGLGFGLGAKAIGGAINSAPTIKENIPYIKKKVADAIGLIREEGNKTKMFLSEGMKVKWNKHIRRTGKGGPKGNLNDQTTEMSKRFAGYTENGTPILKSESMLAQSYEKTRQRALNLKQETGRELKVLSEKLDDMKMDPVDGEQVYGTIIKNLEDKKLIPLASDVTDAGIASRLKIINQIKRKFKITPKTKISSVSSLQPTSKEGPTTIYGMVKETTEDTTETFVKHTPSSLQELKQRTANKINWDKEKATPSDDIEKEVVKTVRGYIEGFEAQATKIDPAFMKSYNKVNTKYSDMVMLENSTREAANASKNIFSIQRIKLMSEGVMSRLPDTMGKKMAQTGALVGSLKMIANDAKADDRTKESIEKVTSFIDNNPDSDYVKRILVGVHASDLMPEENDAPFKDAVESVASEIDLLGSPIKRNLADIKLKANSILGTLQYHSPQMAESFREALTIGDDEGIRIAIDQMSKMPEVKYIFEDGKGIDGRVFSPEDIQQLKSEVDSMDVSYIQKLKHHKGLDLNGTVPQIQQEPERFFKYKSRDKSKPNY